MKRYALIGEHLGHSWSREIHEAFFRLMGIEARYDLTELAPETLEDGVRRLLAEADGFNVTIPYKRRVMPFLSALDDTARTLGAVNTVVLVDGSATGFNTDLYGFMEMLCRAGIDPAGQPCFILGTGGVSGAARAGLLAMGASSVMLVSRHPAAGQLSYAELPERFSGVLVNATPAGMLHFPDACPLSDDALRQILPRAAAVADIVANPLETPLLKSAGEAGLPCCGGLTMLVAQAMEAERLWQGLTKLPDGLTDAVLQEVIQTLGLNTGR